MTKRDYIDFDGPCTDSCRSHGFVIRVSRQSRLVTGSSAMQNYKQCSLVGPASFAWGEKGVWPTSIEALMTAECGSNSTSHKICNFHLTIHNSSCFDSILISGNCHGMYSSTITHIYLILHQRSKRCATTTSILLPSGLWYRTS